MESCRCSEFYLPSSVFSWFFSARGLLERAVTRKMGGLFDMAMWYMFGRRAGRAETKAKWLLPFTPPRGRPVPQPARQARGISLGPGSTGADCHSDLAKKKIAKRGIF